MLKVIVAKDELYDEKTNTFSYIDGFEVELEHSLLSLSKWEALHQKPFLSSKGTTREEMFDYVKCMVLTPNISDDMLLSAASQIFDEVNVYINSPQSATTFGEMPKGRGPNETITSELIYAWLVMFNIPFECETWHLNRLFSLIRICNIKNQKPKKMSPGEIARRNHEINERRKAELGTSG